MVNRKGSRRERELVENPGYDAGIHDVPDELDWRVTEIRLNAEDVGIDSLSAEQTEVDGQPGARHVTSSRSIPTVSTSLPAVPERLATSGLRY